ncbi:MAG: 50S ribosomal protein L18 [Planctomycetota bacterium]
MKRTKQESRQRRHWRIRKSVKGSAARPRLAVYRSNKYIYAQLVDDETGRTLAAASSIQKGVAGDGRGASIDAAKAVGKTVAERAKEQGISKACFDRAGYRYHGRVKALADAAREAGLDF